MSKLKIFVSAYACEPGLGSEIGVGWHWVLEMSKYFDLWVLTRKSNQHTIEPWIAEHPEFAGIHFLYYDWPKWARFWKKGMRGVRTYYNIWQWCTNRIVKRTMQEHDIPIYHLLTYGNAMWPVSRYGKKQFFVWGPTSAGVVTPKDFTRHYTWASRQKEAIQRILKKTLCLNAGFRNRCKNADLILCKTDDTMACVPLKYRDKCVQCTDVAVELKDVARYAIEDENGEGVKFLAAGTLVGWRNFDVLIEAFSEAVKQNSTISLQILGGGDEHVRLQRMIADLNMGGYIDLVGQVDMEQYNRYMAMCDVVVNPCFREGAVTVSFDSMSFAKPLICFDTKGYTHYFTDEYSRVIKGVETRREAIERLTQEILYMTDKRRIKEMGVKANRAGKSFDWGHKGKQVYKMIVEAYGK